MNSCDFKAEFSASLLQSSVSHDPSGLLLKKHSILSMLKTVILLNTFVETVISGFIDEYKLQRNSIYLK